MTIERLTSGNAFSTHPVLHPFNPKSHYRTWLPLDYTPDTWPAFEPAPVGNHLYVATVSHLYRFYDEELTALYVGVTTNPTVRWMVHRGTRWWPLSRFLAIEPIAPATRLQVEQDAIGFEQPRFNRVRPFGHYTG